MDSADWVANNPVRNVTLCKVRRRPKSRLPHSEQTGEQPETDGISPDCFFKFSNPDWRESQAPLRPCGVAYLLSTEAWTD